MQEPEILSTLEYPLTKELCATRGHAFEDDGFVSATNPPIYHQTCKYCGQKRHGTPQESIRWTLK